MAGDMMPLEDEMASQEMVSCSISDCIIQFFEGTLRFAFSSFLVCY